MALSFKITNNVAYRLAALLGLLAVALGALGAHSLKEVLSRHDTNAILGSGRVLLFHPRGHVVHAGPARTFASRAMAEFLRRHPAFFRIALFASGDERALAGRGHALGWNQFPRGLGLLGRLRAPTANFARGQAMSR